MFNKVSQKLEGVPETLLLTLYARARESQYANAMVNDEKAVALVNQIACDFSRLRLHRHDEVTIVMRTQAFDRYARDFLARSPDAVVVHIGCGLDTRFGRVDDGRVEWNDLDLPEVIELRKKLIADEGPRHHLLSCSVFDDAWLEALRVYNPRPFLFLAEGVLPYFEEALVKSLVLKLRDGFPGSEFVCDAQTPFIIWADNLQLAFAHINARLHWGLKRGIDVETWGKDIRLLDEWFYFDRPEPRLGAAQLLRYLPGLAKSAGIFHYRLGERPRK